MNTEKRLKVWVSTLSKKQLKKIVAEAVEELIASESVGFYKDTLVPYWDATGENLDGSEDVEL